MSTTNVKFSILIGFRNRELSRVARCIESFAQQSVQNFELIFVDYGSDPEVAASVRKLLSGYSFVYYIYNDTRGWFWNRAHALNTGLVRSNGDYIVSSDIDMIHASDFIERLDKIVKPGVLYHYRCYYLPKKFNYEKIKLDINIQSKYPISSENARGLLVIEKAICLQINGWNETFKIYGGEDNDISQRLVDCGVSTQWLSIGDVTTYHQWHPSHKKEAKVLPYQWRKRITEQLLSYDPQKKREQLSIGRIFNYKERSALLLSDDQCQHFKLDTYFSEQVFRFLETLEKSISKSGFIISHSYDKRLYSFYTRSSFLKRLFKAVNFILGKLRIRVGIGLRYLPESEDIDVFHTRDALFYALEYLLSIDAVDDYQFVFNEKKVKLKVVKK